MWSPERPTTQAKTPTGARAAAFAPRARWPFAGPGAAEAASRAAACPSSPAAAPSRAPSPCARAWRGRGCSTCPGRGTSTCAWATLWLFHVVKDLVRGRGWGGAHVGRWTRGRAATERRHVEPLAQEGHSVWTLRACSKSTPMRDMRLLPPLRDPRPPFPTFLCARGNVLATTRRRVPLAAGLVG